MTPRQRFFWWLRFRRRQAAVGLVAAVVVMGSFGGIAAAAFSGGAGSDTAISIPPLLPIPTTIPFTPTTIADDIVVPPPTTTPRVKPKSATPVKPKPARRPPPKKAAPPKKKTVATARPTTTTTVSPPTTIKPITTVPPETTTTIPPNPKVVSWFDAHRGDYQKLSETVIVAWVDLQQARARTSPATLGPDRVKLGTEIQAEQHDLPMPSGVSAISFSEGLSDLNAAYLGFENVFAELGKGEYALAASNAAALQTDLHNGQSNVNASLQGAGVPASELLPAP